MSALSSFLSSPRARLRMIEGPLQGTKFPLAKRFVIGRGATADLQLFDERISRNHVEVVCGPNGRHWLVDLDSANGTFIGSRRIERVELQLDTTFRIRGNRFIYEQEVPVTPDAKDKARFTTPSGTPQRRETVEYDTSRPIWQPRRAEGEHQDEEQLRGSEPLPDTATSVDGMPYPGNIAEDIARYCGLERRRARNELDSTDELDTLEQLRRSLYPANADGSPTDARFSCCFPAALRLPSGHGLAVDMVDIGIDGARIGVRDHRLERGTTAWLTTDLVTGNQTRTLVFPCVVAWARPDELSLSFATHEDAIVQLTHRDFLRNADQGTVSVELRLKHSS